MKLAIHMLSASYRRVLAKGGRIKPKNTASLQLSPEAAEAAHNIALGVFEDCCNAGMSFQDALVSIYLSGLNYGASSSGL